MAKARKAVYLGRMNPLHKGHLRVLDNIFQNHKPEDVSVVIGSSNAPLSLHNVFSYEERGDFLRLVYPDLRIAGLADQPGDNAQWLRSLDDLLRFGGVDPRTAIYYGGQPEDVEIYQQAGREVIIVDRYNPNTPEISASKVRTFLAQQRYEELKPLLHSLVYEEVMRIFPEKWKRLI